MYTIQLPQSDTHFFKNFISPLPVYVMTFLILYEDRH